MNADGLKDCVVLRYFDIEVYRFFFFSNFCFLFRSISFSLGLCILFIFFKIRVGTVLCSLTVKHERTPAVKSIMIPCWNELVRFSALYSHADAAKHLTAVEVKDLWISQTWCAFLSHAYNDCPEKPAWQILKYIQQDKSSELLGERGHNQSLHIWLHINI